MNLINSKKCVKFHECKGLKEKEFKENKFKDLQYNTASSISLGS